MNESRAANPGIDWSEKIDLIIPALLEAQRKIGPAHKVARNDHLKSRYADLNEVQGCCLGPLNEAGILLLFPLSGRVLSCLLVHASGQWGRSWIELPATRPKAKEGDGSVPLTSQETGGAITYYRRYLLSALLALATEDDDGECAVGRGTAPSRRPRASSSGDGQTTDPSEFWVALGRLETDAAAYWERELTAAGVPSDACKPLPNQFQVINHLCKRGIEKGLIDNAVGKDDDPGTWDRAKVREAVARLYARMPEKVMTHVENYLREHEDALRAELKMPARASRKPQEDHGESSRAPEQSPAREPGSDDDRPRSGKALFAWTKEQEQRHEVGLLKYLNSWAKLQELPARMVDWDREQVHLAYIEACRKLQSLQQQRAVQEDYEEALAN